MIKSKNEGVPYDRSALGLSHMNPASLEVMRIQLRKECEGNELPKWRQVIVISATIGA